ncbi:unnamed protein product [Brassica oleracea]
MSSSIWFDWASSGFDIYLDGTRRPSHPPRLPNQTEKTLPLLIHPVNPFIKSINHDLAFNASLRCISEYIKVSLLLEMFSYSLFFFFFEFSLLLFMYCSQSS